MNKKLWDNISIYLFLALIIFLPIIRCKSGFFKYNNIRAAQYLLLYLPISLFIIILFSKNELLIKFFLSLCLISCLFIYTSLDAYYVFLNIFLAITLINFIKEKVDQKVIKLLIVISCYLVCYFYTIDKLPKNAWIVGAYIAISLPILLSFTNNNYVNIGIILIPLVSMFLCTSYTVAIASIGGIIGYFIFEKEYILCLILMLLLSILFFSLYRHKKIDVVYRLNLWSRSLKKADFTLFGDGLRLYKNYKFMAGQNTKTTHAHNEFIELYCELGLIGIMIVALYIISLFKIHAPNEYKAMLLAILIMCFGYYPLRIPSLGLLTIINIGIINKYKTKRRFANV